MTPKERNRSLGSTQECVEGKKDQTWRERTHLSRAEPWVWLLVSLEKTLRSFLVLRGGEEGGV